MSLLFAVDISDREDLGDLVQKLLEEMVPAAFFQVAGGVSCLDKIQNDEFEPIVKKLSECQFVYIWEGSRGKLEPIAGFIANESLRRAKLQYLIDSNAPTFEPELNKRTAGTLAVFIRTLLNKHHWLDEVTVPVDVSSIGGMFGLEVTVGEYCNVYLSDRTHRPNSSRAWS